MITISVSGRRATASDLVPLPTGNVQSIKVQIEVPTDEALWQNALIVAVFAAKTPKGAWIVSPGVIDENKQSTIPGDVLSVSESDVYVGIRGTYADNREVTTNIACIGKTCMGAGGEVVDTMISNDALTESTKFLSALYALVTKNVHSHANMPSLDKLLVVSQYSDLLANAAVGTVAAVTDKSEGVKTFSEYNPHTDSESPISISENMTYDENVSVGTEILTIITSTNYEVSSFLISVENGTGSPEYGILEMFFKTEAVNPKPYAVVVASEDVRKEEILYLLEITPGASAEVSAFFVHSFDEMEGVFASEGGDVGNSFALAEGWNAVCLVEDDGDTSVYSAPVNDPNDYFEALGTFDEYDAQASEPYLYDAFSLMFSENKTGIYHKTETGWVDFYKHTAQDDVTMLGFETYSDLVVRDEAIPGESITDVPVFVQGGAGVLCALYEYSSSSQTVSGYDNGVEIVETQQGDTGMPIRILSVTVDGTRYDFFPVDLHNAGGVTIVSAGWNVNDMPSDAPIISGFNPNRFKDKQGTTYDDLSDIPDHVKSVLHSLSQCINVSAAAMGTIIEPNDNEVVRFAGEIKTNRQYSLTTADDCVFTFPTVEFTNDDLQFVIYLTCTADVDLSFPSGTLLSGGEINSDTGLHKLIGSYHRGADKWTVGGIDYEAVT